MRKLRRHSHDSNMKPLPRKHGEQGVRIAFYKGALVVVKTIKSRNVEMTRPLRKELFVMKEMSHDNLNRFIGACLESAEIMTVTHFCSRGSLKVWLTFNMWLVSLIRMCY